MTTVSLHVDHPSNYPTSLGANISTGISATPAPIAVFRNNSTVPNLRAILQIIHFAALNISEDTLITVQLVGGGVATGGSWAAIANSDLEINKTMTAYVGGIPSLTLYSQAHDSQGNNPETSVTWFTSVENLGLTLPVGQEFAIIATTSVAAATVDIAWSVNWLEKD